jgi:hypothetical protein
MADPLSISNGVAGLISLGVQTVGGLVEYYSSFKPQDTTIARTLTKLENLLKVFELLEGTLQARTNHRQPLTSRAGGILRLPVR